MDFDKSIFGIEVNEGIIHRMVRYQLAKKRSGNHKNKGYLRDIWDNKKTI